MTFEELYQPILDASSEQEAEKAFKHLVDFTLLNSAWADTPNNRRRAEDIIREEIEFLSKYERYEKSVRMQTLFKLQTAKLFASTS